MKNKKVKMLIKILIIIAIFVAGMVVQNILSNANIFGGDGTTTTTKTSEVEVGTQTIENTLTNSGEILSSGTENLTLTTTKYFKEMCVEEDDIVKMGENILQYTDGTYLTAPYDCLISSYSVPESGSICTSSNYVQVQNMKTMNVEISVSESDINKVAKGQEVQIELSAIENKTYTGTIISIDSAGTYSTSGTTFSATIEFENDGEAKIGMSAVCEITLEKAENVVAIPIEAVQTKDNQKYVVVVKDNGETENVDIETGISNDSYVQVKSGLSGGEKVQIVETVTTNTNKSKNKSNSKSGSDMMQMGPGKNGGDMPSGDMGRHQEGGQMPGGEK